MPSRYIRGAWFDQLALLPLAFVVLLVAGLETLIQMVRRKLAAKEASK